MGIGALLSGLKSESIYRRTAVKDKHERLDRINKTTNLVLFGLSSVITLIIYYIFIK